MSAYQLDMTVPDFTQPAEGRRAVQVEGETWYLPQGLGYDTYKGTWRVNFEGRPRWRTKLADAWALHQELYGQGLTAGGSFVPRPHSGVPKLDPGIKGVSVTVSRNGPQWRFCVEVSQRINGKPTKNRVVQQVVHTLDQTGIDDVMMVAAAMRWTHERQVEQGTATELVSVDTYDIDLLPEQPVQHVWLTDVLQVVRIKEGRPL